MKRTYAIMCVDCEEIWDIRSAKECPKCASSHWIRIATAIPPMGTAQPFIREGENGKSLSGKSIQ